MTRIRKIALLLAGAAAALTAANTPEASFETAKRAWSGKDFQTAFDQFEAALNADPDNIQYGSEYRQAVVELARKQHPKEGAPADFERSLKFFETLTAAHPNAPNAWLNYGFSYVDKIPAAGSITQVLLANSALGFFTKSIDSKPSWIALYTRGNSYLYWPKIFNRAQMGVNDLEAAYKMQQGQPVKSFYVRVYVSLGDGYWKIDNLEKARAMWTEGAKHFPGNKALKDRLSKEGDDLKTYIDDVLDPNKRVDTDLREIWVAK